MPVPLESAQLPAPRLKPGDLADITVADRRNRAVHALGKAYRDVVRGFRGDFANAPDFVAYRDPSAMSSGSWNGPTPSTPR